jgi:YjbE family integral membrane protein
LELFSPEFFSALFAIIVIDLVLAGDNAIVIALAARSLPKHLQRRAIVWGAVGAIVVRTLLTIVVVWLLRIPGLMFVGGALLIWIAYKLLLPEEAGNGEGEIKAAKGFWGAIQTIVVADMVMGLDNVLAVAGAAHGSYLLVVLGLLISIPIVVWGSSLLLGFVERFPAIVYLGAGVLAWTAAKMITAEPHLADAFATYRFTVPLTFAVIVFGVLWAGFTRNHRRLESRISARLAFFAKQRETQQANPISSQGENTMSKILVPVDGSRNSRYAVRHIVNEFLKNPVLEIHVLNVQAPFSRYISRFSGKRNREAFHREEAEKALKPMRRLLESHGVPYVVHVEVGSKAQMIADTARRLQCDHILMSTARKNSLTRMLEDSVTNKVLELTTVPVQIIAGDAISRWERYGIPAGLGAAVGLFLLAAD